MAARRIAVLFDAENNGCDVARAALTMLASRGTVQIKRAVGDFSSENLASWIDFSRNGGIELVLQPSLGKGKNGADIRLTIEAMDIAHQGHVDTMALVTCDKDFTPLALRLREAGLDVLGFGRKAASLAFSAACSSFDVVEPAAGTAAAPSTAPAQGLDKKRLARLQKVVETACQAGPVTSITLHKAIALAEPELLPLLGGKGKFQKTLCKQGLVRIVGSGNGQRLAAA